MNLADNSAIYYRYSQPSLFSTGNLELDFYFIFILSINDLKIDI